LKKTLKPSSTIMRSKSHVPATPRRPSDSASVTTPPASARIPGAVLARRPAEPVGREVDEHDREHRDAERDLGQEPAQALGRSHQRAEIRSDAAASATRSGGFCVAARTRAFSFWSASFCKFRIGVG
jgi:hypothetical protein